MLWTSSKIIKKKILIQSKQSKEKEANLRLAENFSRTAYRKTFSRLQFIV